MSAPPPAADPAADVIACYSYATGVSLELPAGFLTAREGPASADYLDTDGAGTDGPDMSSAGRRVRVARVADVDGDVEAALAELADAIAQDAEVLDRARGTVDDGPAVTTLVRDTDGVLRHETVLAFGPTLVTVVASGDVDSIAGWAGDAVASIRYVPL